MKPILFRIAHGIAEFVRMAFLSLVPVAVVYMDSVWIGHCVGELSLTVILQEVLLVNTALIFWYGAWKHPSQRGFLILTAGFFSCALIREMDFIFDMIADGFWAWPANLIALLCIAYVARYCRTTVLQPMADFIDTRPYFYIAFGLATLLIFSRTFGSGSLLWKHVVDGDILFSFKSALQEGLELFGYVFIACGTILYSRSWGSR